MTDTVRTRSYLSGTSFPSSKSGGITAQDIRDLLASVYLSGDSPTFASETLTGGTVTVSTPLINATQTWNASGVTFTGWEMNVTDTASAAGSLLIDLEVGSTSQFTVDKTGNIYSFGANINKTSDVKLSSAFFSKYATGQLISWNGGMFAWTDNANPSSGTVDVALARNASGSMEVNNGTAGTFRDLAARSFKGTMKVGA